MRGSASDLDGEELVSCRLAYEGNSISSSVCVCGSGEGFLFSFP